MLVRLARTRPCMEPPTPPGPEPESKPAPWPDAEAERTPQLLWHERCHDDPARRWMRDRSASAIRRALPSEAAPRDA